METIKTGHERPANLISARLLWKAPWWAHYPETARKAVLGIKKQHSWQAWVDYTKAPPNNGGPRSSQIIDRRGIVFQYFGEDRTITVIGFSRSIGHESMHPSGKRPAWWVGGGWDPKRMGQRTLYHHAWWCVDGSGQPFELKWKGMSQKVRIISMP